MAITSVREVWHGRKSPFDQTGLREYTRVYQVLTDSPYTAAAQVRQAPGIPRLFDRYVTSTESDTSARVKKVTADQDDAHPQKWKVTVEYSTNTNPYQNNVATDGSQNDPTKLQPEIRFSFQQFKRPAEEDVNGKTIQNSAGYPFNPRPEMDDSRPVITITRYESSFTADKAIQYQDAVNSDTWFNCQPQQAKMNNIAAELVTVNGIAYWKVTYEIHIRRDGWRLQVLDAGYYEKGTDPADATKPMGKPIRDQLGQLVTTPQPLDGNGNRLTVSGTAIFLIFQVYKELPFSALRLT